jgi:transposase, IS5 family
MVDLAIPEFGYQNHVSADRRHRLIHRWLVTDAAAHAGARLADLLDPGNTASEVWADTGYRSKKNEDLLRQRMLKSHIHRKKPAGRPMPDRTARANAKRSAVRAQIEHVFAEQKARMGLLVRTIGLARATTKIARQRRPQHAPPALAGTPADARLTIQRLTRSAGHRTTETNRNRYPASQIDQIMPWAYAKPVA